MYVLGKTLLYKPGAGGIELRQQGGLPPPPS
jgi:hypothetical protein